MGPDDLTLRNTARARDVVFDDRELARRARTALVAADYGVVSTTAGLGRGREQLRVETFDEDGEPVLVLPNGSCAADAARAGRLGSVCIDPVGTGLRVRLTGRLVAVTALVGFGPRWSPEGNPLPCTPRLRPGQSLAALRVEEVYVGCPCPYPPARDSERRIPLECYAVARPDYLAAHAPRMAAHLSAHHAGQLRCLAGQVSGQPAGQVAAAMMTGLSGSLLELRYVDRDGAHDTQIELRPPARSVGDLANTLRRLLQSATGRPAA